MKTDKVKVRLGISDIVLTEKEVENLNYYINVYDKDGNIVATTETYYVGCEDEEGNECDEEGNLF